MKGTMTQMGEVSDKPSYELLAEGIYTFLVQTKKDSTTKNGDPMVSVTLEVTDGPCAGRLVWDNIILSANPDSPGWKVRWRAKMFLKAIGEEHHGDNFAWDSDRWVYTKCKGKVIHQEQTQEGKYKGQKKAVIAEYGPINGGDPVFHEEKDPQIPF